MTNAAAHERDLHLLRLLIERTLEDELGDAPELRVTALDVAADPRNADREIVQVRFEPARKVTVTVTDWRWIGSRPGLEDLCRKAGEMAETITAIHAEADELKTVLSEVDAAVRREIAKARRRDIPYRLESIGLSPVPAGSTEKPYVLVRLERLGASLVAEIVELEFDDAEQVSTAFVHMLDTQKARHRRLVVLQAAGADGEIDVVALRLMELQGCNVPAILARLPHAEHGLLDVDLPPGAGGHMVLRWKDGIVEANVSLTESVHWDKGRVSFQEAPERFPAKPHGRKLSDFFVHAALPVDLLVQSGHRSLEAAYATVPVATARFNSVKGIAWAA